MSSKARLASVLELMLDRLDNIEQKLDGKLEQAITVATDTRTAVDDLRSHVLDEANRNGLERRQVAKSVQGQEARLTKVERVVFPPQAAE